MKKLKSLTINLILVTFPLLPKNVLAQITNNYYDFIPSSPNMTELSRFSYMPVSYYTGIPNISINLGTLNCGTLSVPISVSYYAGGIKVDQVASNIGLGWSLNAGGIISQTVCKENDLEHLSRRYVLSEKEVKDNKHLSKDEMLSLCMDGVDCAPDIFSYNFMGHTGQFIMDKDQKFYDIHGSHYLDITYKDHAFVITDLYGNIFTFSDLETCETCTRFYSCSLSENKLYKSRSDARTFNVPTGYYLTKIQDPNGIHSISFYYTKETYSVDNRLEGSLYFDVHSAKEGHNAWKESGLLSQDSPEGSHMANVPESNFSQTTTTYNALRLSKIETNTGENCVLSYSNTDRKDLPGSKQISQITINTKDETPSCWKFNCAYFESSTKTLDGSKPDLNYRLKLHGIDRVSCDNKTKLSYNFCYYGETPDEPQLPYRNAFKGQDYWGYCNGKTDSYETAKISNIFPCMKDLNYQDHETINMSGVTGYPGNDETFSFAFGSDHEVSSEYAKAFSLKSISYPTGETAYFHYEPNEYYYAGSRIVGETSAGGLRIKDITYKDNGGNQLSQKYEYDKANTAGYDISTGVLTNIPMHITQRPLPLSNTKNGEQEYDIFLKLNSRSFNPACTFSGDYIGYEEVTETTSEGKTVYNFTSSRDATQKYEVTLMRQWGDEYSERLSSVPYPAIYKTANMGYLYEPTPNGFIGDSWKRGLMKSKKIYDSSNMLVSSEEYEYSDSLYHNIYGIEPFKLSSGSSTGSSTFSSTLANIFATRYRIPIGKSTKVSSKVTEYRNHVSMNSEQRFYYNEHDLPTKTITKHNDGDSTVVLQHYPSDIIYGVYPQMATRRMLAYPIETIVNHNDKAYDLCLKTYEVNNGQILQKEDYSVTAKGPTHITAYNGNVKDCHYTIANFAITNYDKRGRMISTTDRNNLSHVFAWDIYGRLIMHIENATLEEVLPFCPGIADGEVSDEKIVQLRNNLKKASVTSYKYENGKLRCITSPRGIETYFDHDGFGRLIEERDVNHSITKSYQYHYAAEHEN